MRELPGDVPPFADRFQAKPDDADVHPHGLAGHPRIDRPAVEARNGLAEPFGDRPRVVAAVGIRNEEADRVAGAPSPSDATGRFILIGVRTQRRIGPPCGNVMLPMGLDRPAAEAGDHRVQRNLSDQSFWTSKPSTSTSSRWLIRTPTMPSVRAVTPLLGVVWTTVPLTT